MYKHVLSCSPTECPQIEIRIGLSSNAIQYALNLKTSASLNQFYIN